MKKKGLLIIILSLVMAFSSACGTNGLLPISSNTPSPKGTDPFLGEKTSFKDLRIGGAGKLDNIYVGLQYVKIMSYLPTNLIDRKVPSDHEVVLGFFEFYNGGEKVIDCNPDKVTCYADGIQVTEVDSFGVVVDGVQHHDYMNLDPGYSLLSVQNFEVEKGWNELKFFYGSDCIWTVSNSDVSEKEFVKSSLFSVERNNPLTEHGTVVYSGDDYELIYMGCCFYNTEYLLRERHYVAFKFQLTNKGKAELDRKSSTMADNMHAYQAGFSLGFSVYGFEPKIDGYISYNSINTVAPGMTTKFYVLFENIDDSPNLVMIYDDGFPKSQYRCTVYDVAE